MSNARVWAGQNLEPAPEEKRNEDEGERVVHDKNSTHVLPSKPNVPLPAGERGNKREVLPVGPEDCWFCLSNPQCAKHLIVALGEFVEWIGTV